MLVYLIASSMNKLAPVASRAIRWASAWHKPVISAVTLACLAWTWRGQAQRLWASVRTLVHRHVLRPRPATYGDLGRDRGTPEATRGFPQASGPTGMPVPAFWGEASRQADAQEFSNPAYGATGPTRPHSVESFFLLTPALAQTTALEQPLLPQWRQPSLLLRYRWAIPGISGLC